MRHASNPGDTALEPYLTAASGRSLRRAFLAPVLIGTWMAGGLGVGVLLAFVARFIGIDSTPFTLTGIFFFVTGPVLVFVLFFRALRLVREAVAAIQSGDLVTTELRAKSVLLMRSPNDANESYAYYLLGLVAERRGDFLASGELFALAMERSTLRRANPLRTNGIQRFCALAYAHAGVGFALTNQGPRALGAINEAKSMLVGYADKDMFQSIIEMENERHPVPLVHLAELLTAVAFEQHEAAASFAAKIAHEGAFLHPHEQALAMRALKGAR